MAGVVGSAKVAALSGRGRSWNIPGECIGRDEFPPDSGLNLVAIRPSVPTTEQSATGSRISRPPHRNRPPEKCPPYANLPKTELRGKATQVREPRACARVAHRGLYVQSFSSWEAASSRPPDWGSTRRAVFCLDRSKKMGKSLETMTLSCCKPYKAFGNPRTALWSVRHERSDQEVLRPGRFEWATS